MSRSTWACELKFVNGCIGYFFLMSRSTWACELKFRNVFHFAIIMGVTLHVSVWVEIINRGYFFNFLSVTLHVSVWVEIWQRSVNSHCYEGHAPRERVSWNSEWGNNFPFGYRHAPRERVSWNAWTARTSGNVYVTLHVSVWVEILVSSYCFLNACVTLHVSVWVEIDVQFCRPALKSSRSTWACELKSPNENRLFTLNHVTLHVSVWVEMIVTEFFGAVSLSRSTWACELKYFPFSI